MKDIWLFLFSLGVIFFGWPIISMFGHNLALYFFSAWIIFIFIIFIATMSNKKGDKGG